MSGIDPNVDFESALADAAGVELPAEQAENREGDLSVSAGLTGLEQPRDEGGRFAPAATESSEETPTEAPATGQAEAGEETPAGSSEIDALLEQHGGDANAALAALYQERTNAQTLIGRQSNEVGELRAKIDQLTGYVAALGEQRTETPDLPLVNDEVVEGLEGMFEQQGARGMMEWVIDNRPDLIDSAVQVWAAEDPISAASYQGRRAAYEVVGQQEVPQAQSDPIIESMRQERALGDAIDQARADLGIGDEDWAAVRDQITPAFEDSNTPSLIKNAVVSADPQQQVEGMKNLMQVARTRAVTAATAAATEQATTAAQAQAAGRKQAAQVITGSLRPTGASMQGQPGAEMTKEERTSAFKEALLKTEVTSVADGLTGLS